MTLVHHPLIAVLLGTDHHPFPRVLAWAEELSATGTEVWFVQHGFTALPTGLSGVPMLAVAELQELLDRTDAVVTHGGPGLIMEARTAGHIPIVVPRDPALGEHVDNHQQMFARRLARDGLVGLATSRHQLREEISRSLARGRLTIVSGVQVHEASARLGVLVDELLNHA